MAELIGRNVRLVYAREDQYVRAGVELYVGAQFIMTSGYMLTDDLQDIRDRDLIYWLAKPAELESLAEVVAQAISPPN